MSHIKRLSAPKTWNILRKHRKFIARPAPSGQSLEHSLSLLSVVRDSLGLVHTARELKALLREKKVVVEGSSRINVHTGVGLLDAVSFPSSDQSYRMVINEAGKLELVAITSKETGLKICKITGKRTIRKGKTQITLHDGRTLLTETTMNVGDSVVLRIPEFAVDQVLKLEKGAYIYLIGGKNKGAHGKLTSLVGQKVMYQRDHETLETLKKYVMVVGKDKPLVTINNEN
jgi:small subunit ribosomal protein S4e